MLFNSVEFLIFFPIVILMYFIIPHKWNKLWLLVSSYYFYMGWNPKYAILIAIVTMLTWGSAIGIEEIRIRNEVGTRCLTKGIFVIGIVGTFSILGFYKYFDFLLYNIQALVEKFYVDLEINGFDVILPVGISFYTFQSVGYLIDVYRKEIKAERNILNYALFIAFFPQLVAGPIERSKNLLYQIHQKHYFERNRVKNGLLLMLWGFFEKLIIADRIAILVTDVYDNYTDYYGIHIIVATILFAIQIYCDFSGYSDIAIGAARVMGFTLTPNFDSPYYSTTVHEFWRKWHISLTTWFRDYVYIPLGGNRKGKLIKYRNVLLTFSLSGLWHGASWNYIVWGALNGIYQIFADVTQELRIKLKKILKINVNCWSYKFFSACITFILVDFAWLFFRASSCSTAINMILYAARNMNIPKLFDPISVFGIDTMALDQKDFLILVLAIVILGVVDYFKQKVDLKGALAKQNIVFRYLVYYIMIFTILIFGVYGPSYDASEFIYFQF